MSDATNPMPTHVAIQEPDRLVIDWSNDTRREYTFAELRDHCPCATCREKRSAPEAQKPLFPVLSPAEAAPMRVAGLQPVGNYAYSIVFSDGHDTGIYTLEFLLQLGREVSP